MVARRAGLRIGSLAPWRTTVRADTGDATTRGLWHGGGVADPTGVPNAVPNPLETLTLSDVRRRTSAKWRAFPRDVLPMWVAEMDVALAEPVARALTEAVRAGDTGYSAGHAYPEALAAFAAQRWGWDDLAVGRTALVADVMIGVVEALGLLTEPGDTVVVTSPVYPPFFAYPAHHGRRVVQARLGADHRLDLDALAEAFTRARAGGGRAALLLCNPHNPTGTVHTRAELEAVAALAREHGVRVVADEIHAPLVLSGARFTPYLTVDDAGLAVHSASKAWNLAGVKAAVLVAGPGAAADLARLPEVVAHGPSHLGVLAHTAALAESGAWLDALLAGLDANRALLGGLLAEHLPGVGWTPPAATYLAWLDFRPLGLAATDEGGPGDVTSRSGPAAWLTRHARVALSSGAAFGDGGHGHARLNFATSAAVLTDAVTAMGAALRCRAGE